MKLEIDDGTLSLDTLHHVLHEPLNVTLSDRARQRVDDAAQVVARMAQNPDATYGVNTGFGKLCQTRVDKQQTDQLQVNLILSHAVGVGPSMPPHLVRLMMLLKVNALARGFSGVTLTTIKCLLQMINHDVTPVIPLQGSLGASGDLAPLAHMVLPMIGRGEVIYQGQRMDAGKAFDLAGIKPISLGPKEGLALINGTQFMLAFAVELTLRAERLATHADIIGACTVEARQGSHAPFAERLHDLRPHPGARVVAGNMRRLMADSEINRSHANCGRVQDPYSLRCIPQVHGAARDALAHVREVVEIEVNAVTDNPVIFEDDTAISGGLFHGEPLALTMDYLGIAVAELGSISERRTYLLLEGDDVLPQLLTKNSGVNSGLMIPQYTAAALVSENKGLATPASVDSIPTSLGQEDHVSMGARAAVKGAQIVENCEHVLAVELLAAAQALDFHPSLLPGKGVEAARSEVRKRITHITDDREFAKDMATAAEIIRTNAIVHAAEAVVGPLA